MAQYQAKTFGNLDYVILDRLDGSLFGRVFKGQWVAMQWTRAGVASSGLPDDALVRVDTDRIAVEVYWIERQDGGRVTRLMRPVSGDGDTIIASKSVNLREGVIEV